MKRRDKQIGRNILIELLLIASVGLLLIPGALAYPQYLDAYNSTFSTNASCSICHVNPEGGGSRNSYGVQFENQINHVTNPGAALLSIGRASVITSGATTTVTATSNATAIAMETPSIETPEITETPVTFEDSTPEATEPITFEDPTPDPTSTPSTPGFGPGVFIAGLLACYFILKGHN